MNTREAYRIVYNDILNKDVGLFLGRFDARKGNDHFMYGVCTVMEFLTYSISDEEGDAFREIWDENFQKSLDEARER